MPNTGIKATINNIYFLNLVNKSFWPYFSTKIISLQDFSKFPSLPPPVGHKKYPDTVRITVSG